MPFITTTPSSSPHHLRELLSYDPLVASADISITIPSVDTHGFTSQPARIEASTPSPIIVAVAFPRW